MRLLLFLCLLLPLPAAAEWHRESRDMMGTRIEVELWSEREEQALRAIARVMDSMAQVNALMNPWDEDSELALLNREAQHRAVPVSAELYTVIERALYYSRLSEGAFDISFASVGQFYDYRAAQAPDAERVAAYRDKINYRAIKLHPQSRSISYDIEGLQVDLGGIAKGYAVDRGIDILVEEGIRGGVVSAGGDSRILGDLGDRPRTIGIRHPRKEGEFAVMIPLADTAISTSGDYERFFIQDGVRVHHILDPGTGRSSASMQSASILSDRAIDSDALSTTTFVLGVGKGLALINSLPGVDAIIIDAEGKLHYSDGLLREQSP
ncbi:MAG: FAD:protein FMN transferase [Halieaceae bacterium]